MSQELNVSRVLAGVEDLLIDATAPNVIEQDRGYTNLTPVTKINSRTLPYLGRLGSSTFVSIGEKLDELQGNINVNSGNIQSNDTDIANLQNRVGANETNITSVTNVVNSNTSSINNIDARVTANTTKINSLRAEFDACCNELKNISLNTAGITALGIRLNNLEIGINQLITDIGITTGLLDPLEDRIYTLETAPPPPPPSDTPVSVKYDDPFGTPKTIWLYSGDTALLGGVNITSIGGAGVTVKDGSSVVYTSTGSVSFYYHELDLNNGSVSR